MDVKFYATTAAKLDTLPIVNGQLIYLEDKDSSYYDIGNTRRPLSGVRLVPSLPQSGQDNVIYVTIDSTTGDASASVWDPSAQQFKVLADKTIATTTTVGLVKPDGTTITITNDGTISCHAEVTSLPASSITYDNSSSGMTAADAQNAIDELSSSLADVAELAEGADTDANTALTRIGQLSDALDALTARVAALETFSTSALVVEDNNSSNSGE